MSPSFIAYIDESGDEGLEFHPGVSEWLVLSAVVTKAATDVDTVKLVDDFRQQFELHPRKQLHFRRLGHTRRLSLIDLIASADLMTISVLIHKPSLTFPEKFEERNRLYFYGVRYLLERVSWYCRDNSWRVGTGDGSVQIVFSKRDDLRYDEIQNYMDVLKANSRRGDCGLDWDVIRPDQFEAYSPGRRWGLQIADAVATGQFFAVRHPDHGEWCADYACGLKPVIYRCRGKYFGYGLKFFPKEAESVLCEQRCDWVRQTYT